MTGIFYYDIATMQTKNEQLLHFCNKLHKLLQTVSHFSNAMFIYRKNAYEEFLLDFVYKKSLRSVNMCRMFSDSAWATISYGKKMQLIDCSQTISNCPRFRVNGVTMVSFGDTVYVGLGSVCSCLWGNYILPIVSIVFVKTFFIPRCLFHFL